MGSATVGRGIESRAVEDFLRRVRSGPAGLAITGEPGIGKTTVWSTTVNEARQQGFRVSSARAAEAESVLAYATVADLVDGLFEGAASTVLDELPTVQRIAIDRVLLSGSGDGPVTDQRMAAAAFTAIVESLAVAHPVLLAIDDVQWLDSSSRAVIAFAVRRLKGRVGVLVTERTEGRGADASSWLQLSRPDGVSVIRLRPMSLGGLHALLAGHLGRALPRPTMRRIHAISGGNPFFAMELARTIEKDPSAGHQVLPPTLAELMRQRTGHLRGPDRSVLLAAACMADPTVDVLAAATSRSVDEVVSSLEAAEAETIVRIDGNRVRFDHPLLARGVYTQASTAERRRMHRTLADVEPHAEVRARHLALAASTADADTLQALDAAAGAAAARGAPAAAAELFELAIGLGGDDPMRRFRAAASLLSAGDAVRSRVVLEPGIAAMKPGALRASALNLLAGLCVYTNGFGEATACLTTALDDAGDNRLLRVQTLLMLSFSQINDGDFTGSLAHADLAVAEADQLGIPPLTSQVLSMWLMVNCICGNGIDDAVRRRALELEDLNLNAPIVFRASANDAQLLAWLGDLDGARARMAEVRQRCEERGAESDLMFVATQSVLFEIWRADFTEAANLADEALERAEQLGGDNSLLVALTVQTAAAAYSGRERIARQMSSRALETAARCGAHRTAEVAITMLAFLEVSLGRHAEALHALDAIITAFARTPSGTEVLTAMFIPDAVESLVALDRAGEAEPLTAALERNGATLDRPWMLAVGGRCRAMILADGGDLDAADRAVRRAMAEHDRLAMPFERARTRLVFGQILRRRRHRQAAATEFDEARAEFEALGVPLWAARARAELDRTGTGAPGTATLTTAERRVAERAAAGSSNREIAADLFVSVKTVERSLSSVYRKLGIRSRAQLFGSLSAPGEFSP